MSSRCIVRFLLACFSSALIVSSCVPLAFQPYESQSLPSPIPSSPYIPQYYSPLPDAEYVSKAATIVVRYGPALNPAMLTDLKFTVRGSKSGLHGGRTILADDQKTVIFKPDTGFVPGEQVAVKVSALQLQGQTPYKPLSYTFKVAIHQEPGTPGSSQLADPPVPAKPPRSAFPDFLTVPQDIPHFVVSKAAADQEEGYVFAAPFYWTESTVGSYLLILNTKGQLVYYRSVADALDAWDFKVQPNGLLSYYDQKDSTIHLLNSRYQQVGTYQAGDGYAADLHDFQILPNGNALLMIYDAETIDMRKYVWGGNKDALVTGLVIQEMDPSRNVIFEWRSWDHFLFQESTARLTDKNIDLVHGNSMAISTDGNLLVSSRNLSEITKIDLQSGNVIWRLGGKANMFKFVNGEPFAYQHDVRQLPNGNISVFDNHATTSSPAPSRGVEYKIDEAVRTATQVWAYGRTPSVFATYMGNAQRLADGNTFLSWGAAYTKAGYPYVSMTEVTPDYSTVFELTFDQPYVSYRAFIFPWHAFPDTQPALAYRREKIGITLAYSWNGATEVAAYQVYGGSARGSLERLERRTRNDFETQSHLTNLSQNECYFQVAALDDSGKELARSKVISTDYENCPPVP